MADEPEQPRRKIGRPRQDTRAEDTPATIYFVNERDYEFCKQAARRFGQRMGVDNVSFSAWARNIIKDAAKRELGIDWEAEEAP